MTPRLSHPHWQRGSATAIARVIAACQSAQEHARKVPPTVEWVLPPFIPAAALCDLHGQAKEGKTTLMLHMVRAIVNGTSFLGQPARRQPVVWFTEQGRKSFAPALDKVGLHDHPQLYVLYNHDVLDIPWAERIGGVVEVAKSAQAGVIVVDTLTKLAGIRGEDENNAGAVLAALDHLEPAKALGIAVVIIKHDRKSGGDLITASRGSGAVEGEADVVFQLVKPGQGIVGPRHLYGIGRLDGVPEETVLTLEDGEFHGGSSGEASWRGRLGEQLKDWRLIESVLPRYKDRNEGSLRELARRLNDRLSRDRIRDRLRELSVALEDHQWLLDEVRIAWEKGSKGDVYFRWCQCSTSFEQTSGIREPLAGRFIFTPDPECDVPGCWGYRGGGDGEAGGGDLGIELPPPQGGTGTKFLETEETVKVRD